MGGYIMRKRKFTVVCRPLDAWEYDEQVWIGVVMAHDEMSAGDMAEAEAAEHWGLETYAEMLFYGKIDLAYCHGMLHKKSSIKI
jgi:hypothetical protein